MGLSTPEKAKKALTEIDRLYVVIKDLRRLVNTQGDTIKGKNTTYKTLAFLSILCAIGTCFLDDLRALFIGHPYLSSKYADDIGILQGIVIGFFVLAFVVFVILGKD